jgi:hypothetical protein
MKKRKFKKYETGGGILGTAMPRRAATPEEMQEAEDKKRGLEASKNERVGFFERLRMGNIDDPRSEAYNKFGAGRGIAERNKATPVTPPSTQYARGFPGMGAPVIPTPTKSDTAPATPPVTPPVTPPDTTPVGLKSALTPQGTGEGGTSPGVQGPSVTPRKRIAKKTVVKTTPDPERIETSGFETMGGMKARMPVGLTRPVTRTRSGTVVKEDMDARNRAGQKVSSDGSGAVVPALLGLAGMAAVKGIKGIKKKREEELNESRPSSMGTRSPRIHEIDPFLSSDLERMSGEGGPNFKKGGKAKVKKYASGGKVSSASTRADGIAKRGKTKCKVY